MNVRPGPITDTAWFKDQRRDCNSLLVHRRRPCHFAMSTLRRCSFSDGSLSWKDSVSITMPKNDREVLGPSILLVAIGTPTCKCVQIYQ